ncbi:hypothetical protein CRE_07692 [Caenorhabditis remanei]|uniref:Uncharacterized protein n=2 Tax=Caenorhabditis remanei TaxID=31234 RepID=E3MZX4_CAERE|nr:hypothetical protein CRE_07692 [Caenorhabditis remanei]
MFDNYGYIAMIVVSSFNINRFYYLHRRADEKLWETQNGLRARLANEDFGGYEKVLRFLGGWFSYVPSYLCWAVIREAFGIVLKKHGGHYPYDNALFTIILTEFVFGAAIRVMFDWYSDSKLLHLIPLIYAVIFSSGQQVGRPPGAHPIITFVGITMGVEPNFLYFFLHAIYIYAGWMLVVKLPLPEALLVRAPYLSERRAQNQKLLNKILKTRKGK